MICICICNKLIIIFYKLIIIFLCKGHKAINSLYVMWVIFFLFIGLYMRYTNKLFANKNTIGFDNRPVIKNETNISIIKEYFLKYDLLTFLQSDTIDINEKLRVIQTSPLLDDLRLNVIQAPNLSKGLKW